jgi:ABC-type nitrate/sulfonate/bicarbonate transport system substrate-binding protein
MKRTVKSGLWVTVLVLLLIAGSAFAGGQKGSRANALNVAWASDLDPGDVADLLGIDLMTSGVKITTTELTEDSAVVASLINENQDIGTIDVTAAVRAIQMGVPLKVIMPTNAKVEFAMVAQADIKSIKDFAGRKVAFHAPGSMTEILPKMLVEKTPGIEHGDIEWVILPESPNRAAAMKAKRIDVTCLEVSDILTLQEEGSFNMLGSFTDVAPEAMATVWVTTEKIYNAKKDLIEQFAVALAKGYKKAYDDKAAWMAKANEATQYDEDRLSKTYDIYREMGMFPSGDLLSKDHWDGMIDFYVSVGELEDPTSYDVVASDVIQKAAAAIK